MSPQSWIDLTRPATAAEAEAANFAFTLTPETRSYLAELTVPELARLLAYRRAMHAGYFSDYRGL